MWLKNQHYLVKVVGGMGKVGGGVVEVGTLEKKNTLMQSDKVVLIFVQKSF